MLRREATRLKGEEMKYARLKGKGMCFTIRSNINY